MANTQRMNIIQSSKDLICDQLDIESIQPFFAIVFDIVEQIAIIVLHDDAQILAAVLETRVGSDNFHHKLGVKHRNDLNFTVLVFGVLENFLYGH